MASDHPTSSTSVDSDLQVNVPHTVRTFIAAPDHNAITRDVSNNMHRALSSMSHIDAQTLVQKILDMIRDDVFRGRLLKVLGTYIRDHPWQSTFFILGIALMLNPLNLIGFGALGPVAGSMAAAWQASIGGSVAAGSLFAILQSVGMAGAITVPLVGAGITVAALAPWGAMPVGPQRWISGADGSPVTDWAQGRHGNPVERWWGGEYGTPVTKWWNGDYGTPVSAWWTGNLDREVANRRRED